MCVLNNISFLVFCDRFLNVVVIGALYAKTIKVNSTPGLSDKCQAHILCDMSY